MAGTSQGSSLAQNCVANSKNCALQQFESPSTHDHHIFPQGTHLTTCSCLPVLTPMQEVRSRNQRMKCINYTFPTEWITKSFRSTLYFLQGKCITTEPNYTGRA